ncbi:uncharacterized protein BDW43DRAFT_263078 [Aspergillus alliaceus]|uniref:uncharacterized protein n=1 Tax=Petromyces alliaceus TaxID=209559 RepID=UPI0012A5173A|nr:uncharacterized protein BDW43DRAFT_263078 [Aspergillus alliaceus]KAB8238116.1 hypothetical protein BDW43DRAFT_263078 [Aspergillus alliaceus]
MHRYEASERPLSPGNYRRNRQPQSPPLGYKYEGCTYRNHFGRELELTRHIKHIHISPRQFPCPLVGCEKSLSRKYNLKGHIMRRCRGLYRH